MRDIAITIVHVAVSLAALCLALLAISIPSGNALIEIPYFMRILLSASGTLLLICAAFAFDWIIDSFSEEEWNELDVVNSRIGEEVFKRNYNYFLARVKLFGGGYLVLCISFGLVTFIMVWIVTFHLKTNIALLQIGLLLWAMICGAAIFMKMMTRKIKGIVWWLIFACSLAAISVLLNFLSLRSA